MTGVERLHADLVRSLASLYLTRSEIAALYSTNRHFYRILHQQPHFWETLYRRDLSSAEDGTGRYLRSEPDYRQAYQAAFRKKGVARTDNAIRRGYEKQLHKPFPSDYLLVGTQEGHSDIVRFLAGRKLDELENYSAYYPDDQVMENDDDFYAAARHAGTVGRQDLLEILLAVSDDGALTANIMSGAIVGASFAGNKDMLDFLRRSFVGSEKSWREFVMRGAAEGDRLDLVNDCLAQGTDCLVTGMKAAAKSGAIRVIRRLLELGHPVGGFPGAMQKAALCGQAEIVKVLTEEGHTPVRNLVILMAATSGSVPTMACVLEKKAPTRRVFGLALDGAAKNGDLAMLKWLIQKGALSFGYTPSAEQIDRFSEHWKELVL